MISYVMILTKQHLLYSTKYNVHQKLYINNESVTVSKGTIYPPSIFHEIYDADDLLTVKSNPLLQDIIWNDLVLNKDVADTIQDSINDFYIPSVSQLQLMGHYPVNLVQTDAFLKVLIKAEKKIENQQMLIPSLAHLSDAQLEYLAKKYKNFYHCLLPHVIDSPSHPHYSRIPNEFGHYPILLEKNCLTVKYLKGNLWPALRFLMQNHAKSIQEHGISLWLNHDFKRTLKYLSDEFYNLQWRIPVDKQIQFWQTLSHRDSNHYYLIQFLSFLGKDPVEYYKKIEDLPLPLIFNLLYKKPQLVLKTAYQIPDGHKTFKEWKAQEINIAHVLGTNKTIKKDMFKKFMALNTGFELSCISDNSELEILFD